MLSYIEVARLDEELEWLEVEAGDSFNDHPCVIRLKIGEATDMAAQFQERYRTKQSIDIAIPEGQVRTLEDFFQEAHHVKVLSRQDAHQPDLQSMLATACYHFKFPERSSFRKSRAARLRMFADEAYQALRNHRTDVAIRRLEWMHILDPGNILAFELKVVCMRSSDRLSACIEVFEAWIDQHPDDLAPRLGLGELWLVLDQNQKARRCFEEILQMDRDHVMALAGLAQAHARLGEDYLSPLIKASLCDSRYTKAMVENYLDFRSTKPRDLEPMTLRAVGERTGMPFKRLMARAHRGVLPFHVSKDTSLLMFSGTELKAYMTLLTRLGLELNAPGSSAAPTKETESSQQLPLFDSREDT